MAGRLAGVRRFRLVRPALRRGLRWPGAGANDRRVPLRDVIAEHARVLLVGINPSLRSEQVGHHFAGPGNPFWRLLYRAGLTPVPLSYEQDQRLAEFGIALTNLCPRATRSAAELTLREKELGRRHLEPKLERLRPGTVAFVGVSVYRAWFGRDASGGAGPKPQVLHGARVFVLPNPSGLNASFPGFADKLVWFKRLREFLEREGAAGSASRAPGLHT